MNLNDYRAKAYGTQSKDIQPKKTKINDTQIEKKTTAKYKSDPELKAATDALTQGGLIKVPEPERGKEDVYRRVAKFLILIGVDQASLVMKHLSQEEIEKILPEITAVRKIEPDEALAIFEEFNDLIERVKERGGTQTAHNILEKAFGKQRAQDLMDRLNLEEEEKPFAYLADKTPERILELLKEESNTIRALVLSYCPAQSAADVINMLNAQDKKEVIMNLAKTKKVLPDVLRCVDKAMHEKSLAQVEVKTNVIDGKNVLAEILKKMDFKSEQDIISTLKDTDPQLGEDLQTRLFTMDDVLNCDDKYLQNYLRHLEDTEIAYLVADKPLTFRSKIFDNMSKGRTDAVLEEEQIRKPMLKKDCNEITQKFYAHLRHAWEDGELIIKGRDEEIYV